MVLEGIVYGKTPSWKSGEGVAEGRVLKVRCTKQKGKKKKKKKKKKRKEEKKKKKEREKKKKKTGGQRSLRSRRRHRLFWSRIEGGG